MYSSPCSSLQDKEVIELSGWQAFVRYILKASSKWTQFLLSLRVHSPRHSSLFSYDSFFNLCTILVNLCCTRLISSRSIVCMDGPINGPSGTLSLSSFVIRRACGVDAFWQLLKTYLLCNCRIRDALKVFTLIGWIILYVLRILA